MKIKSIWLVPLLAFTFVLGFQKAQAQVLPTDGATVIAEVQNGIDNENVNVYLNTPDEASTTLGFGTINASSDDDYHLGPLADPNNPASALVNATIAWAALPGQWQLRAFYASEDDQVKGTEFLSDGVTENPNAGAVLEVAIGFELDPDAAGFVNPNQLHPDPDLDSPDDAGQPYYGDNAGTYRILRLRGDPISIADPTAPFDSPDPNRLADGVSTTVVDGQTERVYEDMGSRPFVLAASTANGAFTGVYQGIVTFELVNNL